MHVTEGSDFVKEYPVILHKAASLSLGTSDLSNRKKGLDYKMFLLAGGDMHSSIFTTVNMKTLKKSF